jgi:hypothetical protein
VTEIAEAVEIAAQHEAGHVVMRWLCGLRATTVTIEQDGSGFCPGTGRRIRLQDALRITLAGPAAEAGLLGAAVLDWEQTRFDDFDEARRLLALDRSPADVEPALRGEFDVVCDVLIPYFDLIDDIAGRLRTTRVLSARAIAALCREYARREQHQTWRNEAPPRD